MSKQYRQKIRIASNMEIYLWVTIHTQSKGYFKADSVDTYKNSNLQNRIISALHNNYLHFKQAFEYI